MFPDSSSCAAGGLYDPGEEGVKIGLDVVAGLAGDSLEAQKEVFDFSVLDLFNICLTEIFRSLVDFTPYMGKGSRLDRLFFYLQVFCSEICKSKRVCFLLYIHAHHMSPL